MRSPALRPLVRVAVAALAASVLPRAQEVRAVDPLGGVRGQDLDVTITGRRLADIAGAWCADRGVQVVGVASDRDDRARLSLRIAADAAFGRHLLHVFTARGIAAPVAFHVGPLPVVAEDRTATAGAPQPIALDTTVDGALDAEDVDWFGFDVAAGQRVTIECEALRLGTSRIDAELELFGADGALLARADDTAFGRYDPVLTWTFATAGRAVVAIRDVALRGSDLHRYRLHVGTFPRPVVAVPAGGRPGERIEVAWIESDGVERSAPLEVPHGADGFEAFPVIDGRVPPTGVPFRIAPWPGVAAVDDPAVEPPTAPFAVHGVLSAGEPHDRFRFRAAKDQRLEIRSLARALGSPLDPVLVVRDAEGRALSSSDDAGGLDALVRFRAPADGVYLVDVRDHLRRGGPTFAWRVEVAPADDRFLLTPGVPGQRAEAFAVAVPQGGRAATVLRGIGVDHGAGIQVGFTGLPQGVVATVPRFVAGSDVVPVVFHAAVDAPLAAGGAVPTAIAVAGDAATERAVAFDHELPLVRVDNDRVYVATRATGLPVAVTAAAPFGLDCTAPPVPLIRGAALRVDFELRRAEGFDGTVTVRAPWTPPGVAASTATVAKADTRGALQFDARGNASLGEFPLVLTATAAIDGVERTVSTAVVWLTVAEPWVDVTLGAVRTEQGIDVAWPLSIARRVDFDGEITAALERLPKGVAAAVPALVPGAAGAPAVQVEVPVTVAADAAIGRHRATYLRVSVRTAAGEVQHVFPVGELRVDAPLSPELRARLEAKRRGDAAGGTR